jgi:hypothetical protein
VSANDSWQLSEQLLQERATGWSAQYAALVFDDPVIRHIPDSLRPLEEALHGVDAGDLKTAATLLSSMLPSSMLPFGGSAAAAGLLGTPFLLSQLSMPELRVATRLISRFQQNPGVSVTSLV